MSCNSALYLANTNSQTITVANESIDFGSVIRRFGSNITTSGGYPVVKGEGYYETIVNVNFKPLSSGAITVQFYQNGMAIPGGTQTIQGSTNLPMAFSFPIIIKQCCNCESTLVATVSAAGTVNGAAMTVKKL